MESLRLPIIPVLGSLILLGCGSGTSGNNNNNNNGAKVNEQAGKQVASQLASAVAKARTGTDGPGAAFAIAAAGQAAQGIVTPSAGSYTAQAHGEKIGAAHQADVSGSADCTATGCTFKSYADSASGAAWTIDGSLSWGNDTFKCDLTMSGDVQGSMWTIHEVCDLKATDTSIDGTFETDGSYSLGGVAGGYGGSSWDSSVTFNDVIYSASGCATSGSIDVEANVTAGGYSSSGSGSVTFDGSGC